MKKPLPRFGFALKVRDMSAAVALGLVLGVFASNSPLDFFSPPAVPASFKPALTIISSLLCVFALSLFFERSSRRGALLLLGGLVVAWLVCLVLAATMLVAAFFLENEIVLGLVLIVVYTALMVLTAVLYWRSLRKVP